MIWVCLKIPLNPLVYHFPYISLPSFSLKKFPLNMVIPIFPSSMNTPKSIGLPVHFPIFSLYQRPFFSWLSPRAAHRASLPPSQPSQRARYAPRCAGQRRARRCCTRAGASVLGGIPCHSYRNREKIKYILIKRIYHGIHS